MASGEVRGRVSEWVRTEMQYDGGTDVSRSEWMRTEMRSDGGTDVGRQCERLGNTVCTGLG